MPAATTPRPAHRAAGAALRLLAAAGLAVDAYIHAKLAPQYDPIKQTVSQGDLFRAEAGLASLAALLVLVWRRPIADAFAWLVAAGGLALLLVYRYIDVGDLGPIPNMYEPFWFWDKKVSAVAEAVAVVAASLLLIGHAWRRSHRRAPVA